MPDPNEPEIVVEVPKKPNDETSILIPTPENNFAELLRYSLSKSAPLESPLWTLAILTPAALGSMWMYVQPSWKAGEAQGGLPFAILQLIGNTTCAGLVVFNIGGHYIDLVKAAWDHLRYLKKHNLIDHKSFNEAQNRLKTCLKCLASGGINAVKKLSQLKLDILLISILISFPYLATALRYREAKLWLSILKAAVTFSVNTVTHTLPVSLILNVPWLRFLLITIPFSIFTIPYSILQKLYRKCRWPLEKQRQYAEQQQSLKNQEAIRAQMIKKLSELIAIMQGPDGFERRCLLYDAKVPKINSINIKEIFNRPDIQSVGTLLGLLLGLDKFYNNQLSIVAQTGRCPTFWRYADSFSNIIQKIVGVGGAVLVGTSISGYLKVNFDLFYNWLDKSITGSSLLMLSPAIAAEVLCTYFGWLAFTGAYDFIYKWATCRPQVPYAFKLSAILSTIFLAVTWSLNCFSYGTALQLVHDSFNATTMFGPKVPDIYGKIVYQILCAAATYGLIAYGDINSSQLSEKFVVPLAKSKCCNSQAKQQYMRIIDSLKRLVALLQEFKPDLLQRMLDEMKDNDELLNFFGLETVANINGEVGKNITQVKIINSGDEENKQSGENGCCARVWNSVKNGCQTFYNNFQRFCFWQNPDQNPCYNGEEDGYSPI